MSRPNLPDCLRLRHVVILPEAAAGTERLAGGRRGLGLCKKMESKMETAIVFWGYIAAKSADCLRHTVASPNCGQAG